MCIPLYLLELYIRTDFLHLSLDYLPPGHPFILTASQFSQAVPARDGQRCGSSPPEQWPLTSEPTLSPRSLPLYLRLSGPPRLYQHVMDSDVTPPPPEQWPLTSEPTLSPRSLPLCLRLSGPPRLYQHVMDSDVAPPHQNNDLWPLNLHCLPGLSLYTYGFPVLPGCTSTWWTAMWLLPHQNNDLWPLNLHCLPGLSLYTYGFPVLPGCTSTWWTAMWLLPHQNNDLWPLNLHCLPGLSLYTYGFPVLPGCTSTWWTAMWLLPTRTMTFDLWTYTVSQVSPFILTAFRSSRAVPARDGQRCGSAPTRTVTFDLRRISEPGLSLRGLCEIPPSCAAPGQAGTQRFFYKFNEETSAKMYTPFWIRFN